MSSLENTKRFRVAILGAGIIAEPHAKALQSLANVDLAAVCDLDDAKAKAFQARFGIRESYRDLDEMLRKVSPDAVHVLLPAALHGPPAEACLAAGAHVFMEKPFCATAEECRRVARTAEIHGRHIGVNHNVTYVPGMLEAIEKIRAWKLGGIEHVTVQYDMPNPGLARGPHSHWMFTGPERMMLELGPHPLSVVYRLVGKVKDCSALATGEMRLTNGSRFFHTWQSSLSCERGTAQVLLSMGKSYPSTWIHILGQDGEALIDLGRFTVHYSQRTHYLRTANLRDGANKSWAFLRQGIAGFMSYSLAALGGPANSWQEISIRNSVADFYKALAAGTAPPAGAEEGTAVVEACEAIVNSALLHAEAKAGAEAARG